MSKKEGDYFQKPTFRTRGSRVSHHIKDMTIPPQEGLVNVERLVDELKMIKRGHYHSRPLFGNKKPR